MQAGQRHIKIIMLLVLLLSSCFMDDKEDELRNRLDEFYFTDFWVRNPRLALIKPSTIEKSTSGYWVFSSKYEIFGTRLNSIFVFDSIVTGRNFRDKSSNRTQDSLLENGNEVNKEFSYSIVEKDTTWYIFDIGAKRTFAFNNYSEFNNKVKKYTKEPIHFEDLDSLYEDFTKWGYLYWYPDSIKMYYKSKYPNGLLRSP